MTKKIIVETTPTPTPTESEEENEEVDTVKFKDKKKKPLNMDDIKASVLSLVQGAIKNEIETPKVKQKRKVSEAVLDKLKLAREKRKKNHEEQKEYNARLLLEQKGYKLNKDKDEPKKEEPKKQVVETAKKQETIEVKKFAPIGSTPIKSTSKNVIQPASTIKPKVNSNPFLEP